MPIEPDAYSPEVIEYWLRHWPQLASAAEGGSGGSGVGAGRGGRFAMVCIKADLEAAADSLPLNWSTTARIFKIQRRWKQYLARCEQAGPRGGEIEQPLVVCYWRMAEFLGWSAESGAA